MLNYLNNYRARRQDGRDVASAFLNLRHQYPSSVADAFTVLSRVDRSRAQGLQALLSARLVERTARALDVALTDDQWLELSHTARNQLSQSASEADINRLLVAQIQTMDLADENQLVLF